jgi:PhoH-like ATPase
MTKLPSLVKTYILDTNVLVHDPLAIYQFKENDLIIPIEVLEELDRFKTDMSERGSNARFVHRELKKLFGDRRASMEKGAVLPSGGKLYVIINPYLIQRDSVSEGMGKLKKFFPDLDKMDHRILACVIWAMENRANPVILVTKDINMMLKALAIGLVAEDYRTDKFPDHSNEIQATHEILALTQHQMQRFASNGEIELTGKDKLGLHQNHYVLFKTSDEHTIPARHMGNGLFRKLKIPSFLQVPQGIAIRPRNLEQQFFLDALLDPTISLVTCAGKAGTGKTILSTASALFQIGQDYYDGVSISRPVVSMGNEIGFLPGDINEKMHPWLQPYHDALNVIMPAHPVKESQFQDKRTSRRAQTRKNDKDNGNNGSRAATPNKPYYRLIEAGILEIEPLGFIRGRSIPNRYFILDEAQQLTPHEVKTIISRMSEGSKLILIGDPTQIDNPYVDSQSNGLVYTRNKLKNQRIAAHVSLTKGERSALAELAVQNM